MNHAIGNGPGGFFVKEPKTGSSARTIPLTKHTSGLLRLMRQDTLMTVGDAYSGSTGTGEQAL